jgi:hypothetical protein
MDPHVRPDRSEDEPAASRASCVPGAAGIGSSRAIAPEDGQASAWGCWPARGRPAPHIGLECADYEGAAGVRPNPDGGGRESSGRLRRGSDGARLGHRQILRVPASTSTHSRDAATREAAWPAVVEDAAKAVVEIGVLTYRFRPAISGGGPCL